MSTISVPLAGRGWRAALDSSAVRVGVLLLMCVALFFYGLGGAELWRTESLRAIIAQQMLDSGNWLVPRLYGEPLFTKPPGMYAAIALCSLPGGQVTEFTARLPSAIAATACVLLFSWYVRRQLGPVAGLAAGLILPMSPMWLDKGSAAEIDMLQVAWVAASIVCFLRATEDEDRPAFGWWLAALLCVAGGVLTKWTAPQFFYGTAIPFLWWRGRLRLLWSWQHLVSAAVAGGLCLAWVVAAVWLEGWDAFWPTFERESASRLVPGYSERPYPWRETLYHPIKLIVTTLPWSAVALLTLRRGFMDLWDERGRRLLQAFHCWAWPQVVFWSLITEHTPRHSFPLFPAVAGLATMVWLAWHTGKLRWRWARLRPAGLLMLCLALWLGAKVVFVQHVLPHRNADRQPRAKGMLLASLVPAHEILYLGQIKDEGILFYFGRPARRLGSLADVPAPGYCLLREDEWQESCGSRHARVVRQLTDQQGDPLVLVRVFR